ncbi:uncharacterized protein LOC135948511 isoform X2 [Cloeon dipterum]|uniref:Uncharacterized protein n=2 Tax=Cloeon dipterum TaxID=197152 RepID=A0A8S1DJE0_9INSE|nr:Hypothetical predicted protein [Cloeon dipterum]
MSQQEMLLQQQFQELVGTVESLRLRRQSLQQVISAEEEKRGRLLEEIQKATQEAEACDNRIKSLVVARDKLDSTITQTETAFEKILENTELLLAITKKTGGEIDEIV